MKITIEFSRTKKLKEEIKQLECRNSDLRQCIEHRDSEIMSLLDTRRIAGENNNQLVNIIFHAEDILNRQKSKNRTKKFTNGTRELIAEFFQLIKYLK